jgi:hypothetical protein
VRPLGVVVASAALVLGVAGNAMACSIKDFSAVAACDGDKGVIRVTDVDPLGVTAEVSVYLENNGADLRLVGKKTIENATAEGVTITFEEDWKPNAEYRIHITADKYVDEDIEPNLVAPAEACKKADTPPEASESPEEPSKAPGKSTGKSTPTPSASDSGTPSTTGGSNNAPSPEGESNLAETGADSHTGPIAAIAAALVMLGAGAVHYSMRRRGSTR